MSIDNPMIKTIREQATKDQVRQHRENLHQEFRDTDLKKVRRMSDTELAIWQANYPNDSPQAVYADKLWKYRLAKHSAKFTAAISFGTAILGYILGYFQGLAEK